MEATFLGDLSHLDRLSWPWSLNEDYSVKSCYAFCHAFSLNNHLFATPSASHYISVDPVFWKLIWGMKIIPKIKIFFWMTANNCLPTMEGLYRRRARTDPLCNICKFLPETTKHILFLCPWTSAVWFASDLNYHVDH